MEERGSKWKREGDGERGRPGGPALPTTVGNVLRGVRGMTRTRCLRKAQRNGTEPVPYRRAQKKGHGSSFRRSTMTSILKRDTLSRPPGRVVLNVSALPGVGLKPIRRKCDLGAANRRLSRC